MELTTTGRPPCLVITSIAGPNAVLRSFAEGCHRRGWRFLLIGDRASPADFSLAHCAYHDLPAQRTLPFRLASLLPEGHYARKNLGYLEAMRQGTSVIVESDDDNLPLEGFWEARSETQRADVPGTGWINAYRYFTDEAVWPRGFALAQVLEAERGPLVTQEVQCPIQQGLADDNPDVDAIYRLTRPLPLRFAVRERPIAMGPGAWCPFNSQNTTWFPRAWPLLYLPSYCGFRNTDIWRSLVALRMLHANGWHLLFHNATVRQERNAHDLLKDFADEVPGYLHNAAIVERLSTLTLAPGEDRIAEGLLACYEVLIGMGLVGGAEIPLLEAWLTDLEGWP